MKKHSIALFAFISILAFLFAFVPMNVAQAKENTQVTLLVRNRTGGIVELKLVDENGNPSWYKYESGQTFTPLSEGNYAYYASTKCGNRSGFFNINVTKELIFDCGNKDIQISLFVPTGNSYCYPVFDYWFSDVPDVNFEEVEVINEPSVIWGQIDTHCSHQQPSEGDAVNSYNAFFNDNLPHYFLQNGHECYQNGNGYYFPCIFPE